MKLSYRLMLLLLVVLIALSTLFACTPDIDNPDNNIPPIINPPSTDNPDPDYKPPSADENGDNTDDKTDENDKDIPTLPPVSTNPNT